MKQKIILRIAVLVAFFIAIFAIGNLSENAYAALPEGSLKITININEEASVTINHFNDLEYKIKYADGVTNRLDSEFEEANGVSVTNRNRL